MGMFSWKCKGCLEEICSPEIAVLVDEDGVYARGEYDGYGRVGGFEIEDFDVAMWHHKCYKEADATNKANLTPSENAPNQGFGAPQERFMEEGNKNPDADFYIR